MQPLSAIHHTRWLASLSGFSIVRYDDQGKILGFFGTAVRLPTNGENRLYSITPVALARAIRDDYYPEPAWEIVEPGRQPVSMSEVVYLSDMIDQVVGNDLATSWGVIYHATTMEGGVRKSVVRENYLDPTCWKKIPYAPPREGISLAERLSPDAVNIAENMPTSWHLATFALFFAAGMKEIPSARLPKSAVVAEMVAAEQELRKRRQAGQAQRERVAKYAPPVLRQMTQAIGATPQGAVLDSVRPPDASYPDPMADIGPGEITRAVSTVIPVSRD